MEQKQVKIIGLKVNENYGILQSCKILFDEKNRLISVKGEVGSGKTTLQKSLQLGTVGSDALKSDKTLYGAINQEVILKDGDIPVFVGCKSDSEGKLIYTIYTKDKEGKKVNEPVIDGVALTPSKYLSSLQTALTWRMDELTSENPTVQKKILLDLYKEDLAKVGVVFDKSSEKYVDSILDRLEKAESLRGEKDFLRKQVGGYSKHLLEHAGVNIDKPETIPTRKDIEALRTSENKLKFEIDNASNGFENEKASKLQKIKNESEEIVLNLKAYNNNSQNQNTIVKNEYTAKLKRFSEGVEKIKNVCSNITDLTDEGIISEELRAAINEDLNKRNDLVEPKEGVYVDLIAFDGGVCVAESSDNEAILEKLDMLKTLRVQYKEESAKTLNADNTAKEESIAALKAEIEAAEANNKICLGVEAFFAWREANEAVQELKKEYSRKLKEIETGVDGLTIEMQEVGEKMNVHLMYNGHYSPEYFSNPGKEVRKLSSYSGTQKPMICLLIQNYLLNKKPKALRYLWIDNVPIDNKTKDLLNVMGEKLDLTIFINITGDFDKNNLESGEILLEGGSVFFNDKKE